jgi:hypothetical protein
MTKQEILEEIAETLDVISDSLEGINTQLEDISLCSKMQMFLKMVELRPDMKDKIAPMLDEMVESMAFDFNNLPEEQE